MEIIKFMGRKASATYLGDGLYAIFDGFSIWLHANSHDDPTDRVCLEPKVFKALIEFEKAAKTKEVIERCKE